MGNAVTCSVTAVSLVVKVVVAGVVVGASVRVPGDVWVLMVVSVE